MTDPLAVALSTCDPVLFEAMERAMEIIERQEDALFKIACGSVGNKELHRTDMRDIAEEALPRHLQEHSLNIDRKGEHASELKAYREARKRKRAE